MSDERDPKQTPEEELAHADDAIIGRVFRRSLVVIALIAVAIVVGVRLTGDDAQQETAQAKDVGAIDDLVQPTAEMPVVPFVDITADAGIDFVHDNGATGDKLLPETMGGG
ncbi:MAG: CRTAC1 family protein, partial [Actinobacteria bacterium]|nr:CRTAC1 family protein [Actinomycetota bacterium]NIX52114.1 CRTAC1 family protein [Actinomycetota bacterium]